MGSGSTPSPPGPVETDLWLGEHGVAETVAEATGVDAEDGLVRPSSPGSAALPRAASRRRTRSLTLITLLASDRATGNVTGQNYIIDGGLIKTT